jgi:aquaporin NIP
MKSNLLQAAIAEFIGTFTLVLIGAGAVTHFANARDAGASINIVIAALAHGLALVSIISTFGAISGAHVNPAVTVGLLVGGKIDLVKAAVYIVVQVAGAVAAAALIRSIFPAANVIGQTTPAAGLNDIQVLLLEGIATFLLVSAVYQSAVYGHFAPNIAIGFTLAACIFFFGPLTGASLNPARTLGPGIVSGALPSIVFYLGGQFFGGALAGVLHAYVLNSKK